jgi:phosphatidylglycerophosphatase A
VERNFGGGLGVMLDDMLAGVFAMVGVIVFRHFWFVAG